jgi:hypothetical protein
MYQLVGADLDYACASTLSDWHKKGLQRFSEFILNQERFLSRTNGKYATAVDQPQTGTAAPPWMTKRGVWLTLSLLLVIGIGLACLKAWKIYDRGRLVYQDVTCLRHLRQVIQERGNTGSLPGHCSSWFPQRLPLNQAPAEVQIFDMAMPALKSLQGDLSTFKQEAQPLLWLSPRLDWVPVYGGDLAAAPALIELVGHMLDAAIYSGDAAGPLLIRLETEDPALDPARLTALLVEAQPQLLQAREEVDQALAIRRTITAERLSPRLN